MKHFILAVWLVLPLSASAQQESEVDEGFSLVEEGAKLLFRGIIAEMEPAINDFSELADELQPALDMLASEMGPAFLDLIQTLDSVRYYEPPEVLPNGDIIIRRASMRRNTIRPPMTVKASTFSPLLDDAPL
jgi:hypothetical protein